MSSPEINQVQTQDQGMPQDAIRNPHDGFGQIVDMLLKEGLLSPDQIEYAARVRTKLEAPRSLLDVMTELKFVSDDQVRDVIRANRGAVRIGELLIELGYISEKDLETAIWLQGEEKPRRKLGEVLVAHHFIEERKLLQVLSYQMGFAFVEPEFMELDRKLLLRAPYRWYESQGFLPIRKEDGKILIAFSDPMDHEALAGARKIFGENISAAITSKASIKAAIIQFRQEEKPSKVKDIHEDSIVDIVDSIILAAVKDGDVSDIHMEPTKDRLRVRFRRDGVMVPYKDFRPELLAGITSRIKVLCEADIMEKRRHQDGRFLFHYPGGDIDLRVSFYITVHGEKIVLRLLNRQTELLKIEDIGMFPRMIERFLEDALERPSGVLIITGPTGSGKTTTVYSCINHLHDPNTSIITAEEPVEYVIDGIAQCSINPKISLTYEETLRHIVRQDPDVVVIGEIRDGFSAGVAVQAALTGHKVLTTFHTEDSIGGLIRLLNMDIDAFLISSTVVCVVAQRLLRKVCPKCARPHTLTAKETRRLGYTPEEIRGGEFRKGTGCPFCRNTGYKGRIAVFELLILNESVRDGLLNRKTSHEIRKISIESTGLVTLLEDGIVKAASGITTAEEVLRCLPRLQKPRPLAELRRLQGNTI